MTAPNLANPTYSTERSKQPKILPSLQQETSFKLSIFLFSSATAVGSGLSAKCLHGHSPSNTAPGVTGQVAFLTLAWLLLGGLQEAAEHEVEGVDSVIHTLPQNPCQLCQVLLDVLLQEAHHIIHWWLDDPSQGLKTTKARVEHSQKHAGKHKAHRAQSCQAPPPVGFLPPGPIRAGVGGCACMEVQELTKIPPGQGGREFGSCILTECPGHLAV